MRRSRHSTEHLGADAGSASLEFITTGLLLLVPIVYLVLAMSALQGAALGVEGAARQASRVFVQSGSIPEAEAAAGRAIEVTLADYGLDASDARVSIGCRPNPAACLTRQGFVTVTIETTVALPLIPPVLDVALPASIPVRASSTEQVSRFAGAR